MYAGCNGDRKFLHKASFTFTLTQGYPTLGGVISLRFHCEASLTLTDLDSSCCLQIPISAVVSFVEALEVGYSKHKNPYHNLMHAADVTQTVHYLLLKTGMVVSQAPLPPVHTRAHTQTHAVCTHKHIQYTHIMGASVAYWLRSWTSNRRVASLNPHQ